MKHSGAFFKQVEGLEAARSKLVQLRRQHRVVERTKAPEYDKAGCECQFCPLLSV